MDRFCEFFKKNIRIILAILLSVVFVQKVYSEKEWAIEESQHFIVYYKNASDMFLNRLIERAEGCYRDIAEEFGFFRRNPWLWEDRAEIYVYDTREEYLSETGMSAWSSGCARPRIKEVYTYSGSGRFLDYTIIHELTHLIFSEFTGGVDLPLWFEEGAAVYMERKGEAHKLKSKIKQVLERNKFIPLADLMGLASVDLDKERDAFDLPVGDNYIELFYLESWSVVYFLIKEYDIYEFKQLVRNLKAGRSFKDSVLRTYRDFRSLKELEKEWKSYYLGT